jgi:cysteine desulfurase
VQEEQGESVHFLEFQLRWNENPLPLCQVFFHTDAAQAVGKIPMDVNAMKIDLMSISGHKLYGPKGVGALYVRRRPRVRVEPIQSGGGQERGIRSGTVPTPLAVGLGACTESPLTVN